MACYRRAVKTMSTNEYANATHFGVLQHSGSISHLIGYVLVYEQDLIRV